jgi:hypothetical protein
MCNRAAALLSLSLLLLALCARAQESACLLYTSDAADQTTHL